MEKIVQMDVWHFMCLQAHPPKKARFFGKTVCVRLLKEFIADLIMHLTNSSLAVDMLKFLIAEDCVFLSWRIKFWSVDSVQGLTENNQVRNEIRNTWNMKYPICPLVIWELLNTMRKSAPFKGLPTLRQTLALMLSQCTISQDPKLMSRYIHFFPSNSFSRIAAFHISITLEILQWKR